MNLLLGEALALLLGAANILPAEVTVLDEGGAAVVDRHILVRLAVLDEALLYIVLRAFLLLLGFIGGLERLCASSVVAVITLDHCVVLVSSHLPPFPLFHSKNTRLTDNVDNVDNDDNVDNVETMLTMLTM